MKKKKKKKKKQTGRPFHQKQNNLRVKLHESFGDVQILPLSVQQKDPI